jgi:dolichyl-phosphate beta-glucosyltransferase
MPASTIVIPCFNEAGRLDSSALLRFVDNNKESRVLLVDDGSSDGTWERIRALEASRPASFSGLRLERNSGKGEAVRLGVLQAIERGAALVGYWDADLATPLDAVPAFEQLLMSDPRLDIVIGSRVRLMGRTVERRSMRHYTGRLFATAASLALGVAVYDTQCGAKLFRVNERTRPLFAHPFQSRWIFDVELLSRYLSQGNRGERCERIYELPLTVWKDITGSKLKPRDFVRAAVDLGRIALTTRRQS